MIDRQLKIKLNRMLESHPATVLIGPRQVGKTTLAFEVARDRNALYLDLERPRDLAKLSDIEKFCELNSDKLLVLDEVQRAPNIFAPLRSIIDERRRAGQKTGQFLLLGSASIDLLKQTSETLAGRVAYCELCSLNVEEVEQSSHLTLWLRGGFPESYLAAGDVQSLEWRQNFIRTYLERDIPQLGPRIPAETLRRFWTMLAHHQGQTFNASAFARSLDVSGVTTTRYLDLMVDLLLVRRLQPWLSNQGKRLVKTPKVYIRDSGLCHALLGLKSMNELLGHPVVGGSWEGFVIETILNALPGHAAYGFYRTSGGAEVDLVVELGTNERWAVEVKLSSAPTVSKGFHIACDDLKPSRKIVVYSGEDSFPMTSGVMAYSLSTVLGIIRALEKSR